MPRQGDFGSVGGRSVGVSRLASCSAVSAQPGTVPTTVAPASRNTTIAVDFVVARTRGPGRASWPPAKSQSIFHWNPPWELPLFVGSSKQLVSAS